MILLLFHNVFLYLPKQMPLNANGSHQVHILHEVPESVIFRTWKYTLRWTSWRQENTFSPERKIKTRSLWNFQIMKRNSGDKREKKSKLQDVNGKWYRWTGLQGRNRDTDVENKCVDTKGGKWGWGGGGGMNWEVGIDIYTLICIK